MGTRDSRQWDTTTTIIWGMVVPLFGVILMVAMCAMTKKYKESRSIKLLVNKSTSTVNLTPVTSISIINNQDAPSTPSEITLRSNDLFSTKASLPRLHLPPLDSHSPPMPVFNSAFQTALSPESNSKLYMLPDTPPSILITNTDSPSFNLAHQKLVSTPMVHPLAVPSTDTVMATLLGDIFLAKVSRSVEIGKSPAGAICKGVWQGASVLLRPINTDKMRQLRDDIIILKNLRHPNIVIFFGLYQPPGETEINVVTEYMEHGNLKEFLKSHNPDYVYKQQMVLFQQQKDIQQHKKEHMELLQPSHYTISTPQFSQKIQAAAKAALEEASAAKASKDPPTKGKTQRSPLTHSHSQSELIAPVRAVPDTLSYPTLPMLTTRDLVKLSRDIAAGMMQLEQKSFAHRNLSAGSILVGGSLPGNLIAKLSDFGLTRHTEFVPSPRWTPPETLQTKRFTTRSDMWSYGVCLYEIFTYGKLPYDDMMESQILNWVLEGNRLHFGSTTPPIVQTIAYRCWDLNPAKRPTFDEIFDLLDNYLQSPYFQ